MMPSTINFFSGRSVTLFTTAEKLLRFLFFESLIAVDKLPSNKIII